MHACRWKEWSSCFAEPCRSVWPPKLQHQHHLVAHCKCRLSQVLPQTSWARIWIFNKIYRQWVCTLKFRSTVQEGNWGIEFAFCSPRVCMWTLYSFPPPLVLSPLSRSPQQIICFFFRAVRTKKVTVPSKKVPVWGFYSSVALFLNCSWPVSSKVFIPTLFSGSLSSIMVSAFGVMLTKAFSTARQIITHFALTNHFLTAHLGNRRSEAS